MLESFLDLENLDDNEDTNRTRENTDRISKSQFKTV